MKSIFLLFFYLPFIFMDLNEIDTCVSQMQSTFKNKDMIKTLSGLVGQGWNDLLNDYTLPVLATRYHRCLSDPDGEYLIPDNVFVVPVRDAEVERTSVEYDSFKEFMSTSSTKVGVSGSATVKGVTIGASFSSENQQTKENFEKKNSVMFMNKLQYYAFDLIANNDDFDEYFVYRLEQIAEAVENEKMLWAQFLAENFIGDFGTHVINKATAGAEIFQQTFIDRIETYKGESNMKQMKTEVSIGFAKIAKLSIGYESKSESSEKHSRSNSTTKSILKTRGGPDITRISQMEINSSLLHIDNLIGLKKSGKFLYEIIPDVPLSKYSSKVRFAVKHLVFNATQDFYRYNYLPGCMDMQSENYNYLANVDDGSCLDPNYLFAFGGIFQSCKTLLSNSSSFAENVIFDNRCIEYEKTNILTGGMNCPIDTSPQLIKSLKVQFYDRTIKIEKEVCGFWSFLFGCNIEKVNETIPDEIQIDTFWCNKNVTVKVKPSGPRKANDLDDILRHEVLIKLNGDPNLLKLYFPHSKFQWQEMKNVEACDLSPSDANYFTFFTSGASLNGTKYQKASNLMSGMDKYYPEMAEAFGAMNSYYVSGHGHVYAYGSGYSYDYSNFKHGLEIHPDQLDTLSHYPTLLKALLPILKIPECIKFSRTIYDAIVENPVILHQLLYYGKENIQRLEPTQIAFFGGAFKGSNLNPFTGKNTCPPNFTKITILMDFNICISVDNELSWPIRLGGFYNCESEEKICPKGYSSYLGYIFENCEYYYCIRFANRQKITRPTLNRPPFIDYNMAFAEIEPKL